MTSPLDELDFARSVAPLAGAAGCALVITAAVEQLGVPRERIAFGTAALAVTLARSTDGAVQGALTGAAAAGVCIGIAQLLERHRPRILYGDKPGPEPVVSPPEAITRADLARTLTGLQAQLAEQARLREEAHQNELKELRDMVRDLAAHLNAARIENERLRTAAAARDAAAEAPAPSVASPTVERPPEPLVDQTAVGEVAGGGDDAPLPEGAARIECVYSLLDASEREQLSTLMAAGTVEDMRQLYAGLAELEPAEAAALLRGTLLSLKEGGP